MTNIGGLECNAYVVKSTDRHVWARLSAMCRLLEGDRVVYIVSLIIGTYIKHTSKVLPYRELPEIAHYSIHSLNKKCHDVARGHCSEGIINSLANCNTNTKSPVQCNTAIAHSNSSLSCCSLETCT